MRMSFGRIRGRAYEGVIILQSNKVPKVIKLGTYLTYSVTYGIQQNSIMMIDDGTR